MSEAERYILKDLFILFEEKQMDIAEYSVERADFYYYICQCCR